MKCTACDTEWPHGGLHRTSADGVTPVIWMCNSCYMEKEPELYAAGKEAWKKVEEARAREKPYNPAVQRKATVMYLNYGKTAAIEDCEARIKKGYSDWYIDFWKDVKERIEGFK